MMKAVVLSKYLSPESVRVTETNRPSPNDGEVLVQVCASCINYADLGMITGTPFIVRLWSGLFRPKLPTPGGDIAGRIVATGKKITEFQAGDEVVGDLSGCHWGAFGEYVTARPEYLARKPKKVSFEEAAAATQAGVVALQGLRDKGKISPGMHVLVHGASAGIGTLALQLAKNMGATVTALCGTGNQELVQSLGADSVIDYTKEDFSRSKIKYDLIVAVAGDRSIFDFRRALKPNGRYVVIGGTMNQIFQGLLLGPLLTLWDKLSGNRKLGNLMAHPDKNDLDFILEQVASKKLKVVIDRAYPFEEISQALAYYQKRHSRGKVTIKISDK